MSTNDPWKVERNAYHHAQSRCIDPDVEGYENYGGRGIQFRFTSFREFYKELGPRPSGTMLDRIENNGHYEKGNVRWITPVESAKNRRERKRQKDARGTQFRVNNPKRPWRARIVTNGKEISLGYFNTENEAHEAYEKAKQK